MPLASIDDQGRPIYPIIQSWNKAWGDDDGNIFAERLVTNWGYPKFATVSDLYPNYVNQDGQVTLKLKYEPVRVPKRSDTGMVGLDNQGATCYMNSLLQVLYHLR